MIRAIFGKKVPSQEEVQAQAEAAQNLRARVDKLVNSDHGKQYKLLKQLPEAQFRRSIDWAA